MEPEGGGLEQGEAPLTTAMVHAVARRHRDGGPVRWGGEAALDMGPTGWNRSGVCPRTRGTGPAAAGAAAAAATTSGSRSNKQQHRQSSPHMDSRGNTATNNNTNQPAIF